MSMEDVEISKRKAAEQRNVIRKSNREARVSFAKEVKDSLAGGEAIGCECQRGANPPQDTVAVYSKGVGVQIS
jgi:hypothetical protein